MGICTSISFPCPEPYTRYKLWLKAFTWKNEGRSSSPPLSATTDVFGPSEPHIVNLTCTDERSILVEWQRPRRVAHTLDFYIVTYYEDKDGRESRDTRHRQVVTVDANSIAFKERKVCCLPTRKTRVKGKCITEISCCSCCSPT